MSYRGDSQPKLRKYVDYRDQSEYSDGKSHTICATRLVAPQAPREMIACQQFRPTSEREYRCAQIKVERLEASFRMARKTLAGDLGKMAESATS